MGKHLSWITGALALVSLAGCGGDGAAIAADLPRDASAELATLRRELEPYPAASIILHGLRPGADTAFHQYKLVWQDPNVADDSLRVRVRYTDWSPIAPALFQEEQPRQGMAIWTKRGGTVDTVPTPPVYAYVGDESYGRWDNDQWVFAPTYFLLAEALDELGDLAEHRHKKHKRYGNRSVVVLPRADYDRYRANPAGYGNSYRERYAGHASARPAAAGTFSAKVGQRMNASAPGASSRPSFVERATARQGQSADRFDSKVKSRMGGGTPAASAPAAPGVSSYSQGSRSGSSGTYRSRSGGSGGSSYSSRRSSGGSSYSSGRSSRSSGRRRH